jgi:L-glyceraldehyde 3-phosphate reductase
MLYQANEKRYDSMTYRFAGHTGLQLPAISLGLWHNFGHSGAPDNMREMLKTAFDLGITHFDLANNYGPPEGAAEENFGRLMQKYFRPYRDELVISTKAGFNMWTGPYGSGGSRKYLLSSLDQSLQRMGLEYVDIFYLHRMTPDTPIEESMLALDQAVRSGKALYVGLSNHDGETGKKATKILEELKTPFVMHQNSYSILDRRIEENGLLDLAKKEDQGLICFKPLDQGLLTDKYLHGIPEDSRIRRDGRFLKESNLTPELLEKIEKLNTMARDRGQTLAQMALAWVYQNPTVTSVLIGASRPEQIVENVKSLENVNFSDDELDRIDTIVEGRAQWKS